MVQNGTLDAEYIVPLRWTDDSDLADLLDYLVRLCQWIPVTVVDGSPQSLFDAHARAWPSGVRHCAPEPWPGGNGKVAGVMTGVRRAAHELIILADDDVRYSFDALRRLLGLLNQAECVLPQNYFDPLPWHARWDTARSLLNRAFGCDYPGTMAVKRSALLDTAGYNGNVLFENLELVRTIEAAGGRALWADDLFVARRPPTTRHFLGQRIRQAYDDFAQPLRLVGELSLLPLIAWSALRPSRAAPLIAVTIAAAEYGRHRHSGHQVFGATASLWAPLWMLERACCVWAAVAVRARGGVRYSGSRIRTAATSRRALATHFALRQALADRNEGVSQDAR